ncbi:MAG: hypothetical protein K9N34_05205 [Candidatus Marinimicrobia bacterium]|nr:hypothetical protein [Candidatus Neomarinimicrobiota bacterium]MCF7902788.1 hypothetical protein [Candidatus Neomarinimicrobiota bacterium]
MSQKHRVLDKAQEQLKSWDRKIDELKAKADVAEAKSQGKYQEEMNRLKEMRRDLAGRIEKYRKSGEEGLAELEKGLEEFGNAFSKALDKFKSIK